MYQMFPSILILWHQEDDKDFFLNEFLFLWTCCWMILKHLSFFGLSQHVDFGVYLSFVNILFPQHWILTTMSATEGLMDFLFRTLHQGCDIGYKTNEIHCFQKVQLPVCTVLQPTCTTECTLSLHLFFYWDLVCSLMLEYPILVDVLGWWE